MKKYFAKLLLVQDETQERLKKLYSPSHKEYIPSMKLFLCSRDIQVGDRIKSYVPVGQPPYKIEKGEAIMHYDHDDTWDYECEDGSITNCGASFCYKIIGVISPKAKWVKEDDEFDEEELIALEWGGSSIRRKVKDIREQFKYKEGSEHPNISVKCPCCETFK